MTDNPTKSQRQSNLELLRILSMMLVMLVHYLPLRSPTTATMLIAQPFKALMNLELRSIAIICVHCFILISGFFGIRWKVKSFLGLMFQLLFWAIIGFFIAKFFIVPFLPSFLIVVPIHLVVFYLLFTLRLKPDGSYRHISSYTF